MKQKRTLSYVDGGHFDKEQLAHMGEGNKKEVVIPLEKNIKHDDTTLLQYAQKKLLGGN